MPLSGSEVSKAVVVLVGHLIISLELCVAHVSPEQIYKEGRFGNLNFERVTRRLGFGCSNYISSMWISTTG